MIVKRSLKLRPVRRIDGRMTRPCPGWISCRFAMRGLEGLSVRDASVMPSIVSGQHQNQPESSSWIVGMDDMRKEVPDDCNGDRPARRRLTRAWHPAQAPGSRDLEELCRGLRRRASAPTVRTRRWVPPGQWPPAGSGPGQAKRWPRCNGPGALGVKAEARWNLDRRQRVGRRAMGYRHHDRNDAIAVAPRGRYQGTRPVLIPSSSPRR